MIKDVLFWYQDLPLFFQQCTAFVMGILTLALIIRIYRICRDYRERSEHKRIVKETEKAQRQIERRKRKTQKVVEQSRYNDFCRDNEQLFKSDEINRKVEDLSV